MRTKAILGALLVAMLLIASPVMSGLAAGKKGGATVVGKDPDGDWGTNADPNLAPAGNFLGQELLGASIGMADAKTFNLVIKVASLPPWGGIPEASRYNWDITVDGTAYQVTGAFTEYLRGVCNPLHTGACPPPQDPGPTPFFVRQGPCNVGADCYLLGTVSATFDPAAGTITIPIPLSLVKAKPGSEIGPGVTTLGGTVYATPAVMVTNAAVPNDTMVVTGTYVIPK